MTVRTPSRNTRPCPAVCSNAAASPATTSREAINSAPRYQAGTGQRNLCTGPLYHGGPLSFSLIMPLSQGIGIVIMEKFDAGEALRLIAEHRITHDRAVCGRNTLARAVAQTLGGAARSKEPNLPGIDSPAPQAVGNLTLLNGLRQGPLRGDSAKAIAHLDSQFGAVM